MLDQDDRLDAGAPGRVDERLHDPVLVAARDAARRLVEQDDLGHERERAGDVEQLFLALRKQARFGVELGVEAEDRGHVAHLGPERGVAAQRAEEAEAAACLRDDGDGDRLGHGQCREDVDELERARHAALGELDRADAGDVLALEADDALVRLQEARENVDERRLAGAVRADDGDGLAVGDRERHAVEGDEVAVGLRHADGLDQRAHRCTLGASRRPAKREEPSFGRPCGRLIAASPSSTRRSPGPSGRAGRR